MIIAQWAQDVSKTSSKMSLKRLGRLKTSLRRLCGLVCRQGVYIPGGIAAMVTLEKEKQLRIINCKSTPYVFQGIV